MLGGGASSSRALRRDQRTERAIGAAEAHADAILNDLVSGLMDLPKEGQRTGKPAWIGYIGVDQQCNKEVLVSDLGRVPGKWEGASVGLYVDANVSFAGKTASCSLTWDATSSRIAPHEREGCGRASERQ